MDPKELRGLMEAYAEVYAPQEVDELYKGKHGQSETEYMDSRSDAGKQISGTSKLSGAAYSHRSYKGVGGPAKPGERQKNQGKMTPADRNELAIRKANLKKEELEQVGEAVKGASRHDIEMRKAAASERRSGIKPLPAKEGEKYAKYKMAQMDYAKRKRMGEEVSVFDVVLEFLQAEGFAETLEEAEWLMANVIDEEAIGIILGEAIYSEKGKAKAAEMIAKRSTPSGRAKSGKGANVAHIRQIRGSGRGDFDREGLGGTPMTPTMAKNPIKKQNYIGTGNKAARRAGLTPTREKPNAWKEEFEFWVNALVEEGYDLSGYTWDEMYEFYLDEDAGIISGLAGLALGAKGASYAAKHTKRMRDYPKNFVKGIVDPRTYGSKKKKEQKEDYVNEAQVANRDPEKYEREQSKKYAPVRGERTPMPPRGDKRREDFEKWYAANVR